MALNNFKSEGDFGEWLGTRPKKESVVLAVRAALRVLPLVGGVSDVEWTSAAFRACSIAWAAAKPEARVSERALFAAARAADVAAEASHFDLTARACVAVDAFKAAGQAADAAAADSAATDSFRRFAPDVCASFAVRLAARAYAAGYVEGTFILDGSALIPWEHLVW